MTIDAPNLAAELKREIARRRTFAIISHPDAGKTTLTEKLLLFAGMLRTAGMVKGRKGSKAATSDWMSMEQERGISITASAMQFHFRDHVINILDTPGHQDFSEDTYRTLTAADSVIMVLDAAKGVEVQTRKLFAAAKLRGIPVFTFINKWDMPGREPLDLLKEVEDTLGIAASPMNWPIGSAKEFQGVVDLATQTMHLYTKTSKGGAALPDTDLVPLASATPTDRLDADMLRALRDEIELVREAGNPFDRDAFFQNRITPVYFGSALINFGIEHLYDAFLELAPAPFARKIAKANGDTATLDPADPKFSAFVFKLQANMDPKHRDCVAFLRINSGKYHKDLQIKVNASTKAIRLPRPHTLVAKERETVIEAYPGDVIGVIDPGLFAIGDTISEMGGFTFEPLPHFQPEHFARVRPKDTGKRKQLDKGIEQLGAEGAVQIMWDWEDITGFPIIGVVGRLQFEVMQYRFRDEYNTETTLEAMPYTCSAWLEGDPATFKKPLNARLVRDRKDRAMALFTNQWEKEKAIRDNPQHRLLDYA